MVWKKLFSFFLQFATHYPLLKYFARNSQAIYFLQRCISWEWCLGQENMYCYFFSKQLSNIIFFSFFEVITCILQFCPIKLCMNDKYDNYYLEVSSNFFSLRKKNWHIGFLLPKRCHSFSNFCIIIRKSLV